MRLSLVIGAILGLAFGSSMILGQGYAETEDTIERLPVPNTQSDQTSLGQRPDRPPRDGKGRSPRKVLVPGGGLLISFDADEDGIVTREETNSAIRAAFLIADANRNNVITALEQNDWVATLKFPDASLVNPVRFDPNIDSRVTPDEFERVILMLHTQYADEISDTIEIGSLYQVPERRGREGRPPRGKGKGGGRGENGPPSDGGRGGGDGPPNAS